VVALDDDGVVAFGDGRAVPGGFHVARRLPRRPAC
jgi:hypothetical protein